MAIDFTEHHLCRRKFFPCEGEKLEMIRQSRAFQSRRMKLNQKRLIARKLRKKLLNQLIMFASNWLASNSKTPTF